MVALPVFKSMGVAPALCQSIASSLASNVTETALLAARVVEAEDADDALPVLRLLGELATVSDHQCQVYAEYNPATLI